MKVYLWSRKTRRGFLSGR